MSDHHVSLKIEGDKVVEVSRSYPDTSSPRDFDARPYSPDEKRVAEFIWERGLGGGDDPIGFILASYAYVVSERNEARAVAQGSLHCGVTDAMVQEACEVYTEVYRDDDKDMGDAMRAALVAVLPDAQGKPDCGAWRPSDLTDEVLDAALSEYWDVSPRHNWTEPQRVGMRKAILTALGVVVSSTDSNSRCGK